MRLSDVSMLGFAATSSAFPSPLQQRQDEDPDQCKYESGDPSAMKSSGATAYLSDFLTNSDDQAWSTRNWLAKLDEKTTKPSDGGSYTSSLNCTQIEDSSHCEIPDQDVQCRYFTPPEVFWIRLTAPNVQTFFDAARNSLVVKALEESLNVDKLTEDFDLGDMNAEPNNLGLIAAIAYVIAPMLGFGGIVAKGVTGSATASERASIAENVVSNLAGGFNLANTLSGMDKDLPPTPRELAIAIEGVYTNFFHTTYDSLTTTNQQFFQGVQDGETDFVQSFADGLQNLGADIDRNQHPVAQILGSGDFATGGSGKLDDILQEGYKIAKAQMVGAVLSAQRVVLFKNQNTDEGTCTSVYGRRWWDGGCYGFSRVKIDDEGGSMTSEDIDWMKVELLEGVDHEYQINLDRMIENIRDCDNNFGRRPDTSLLFDGAYPPCHFGMAFFAANDEPCHMWPGPYGLEHSGCHDEPETLYWKRFKNGEDVQRAGTNPPQ